MGQGARRAASLAAAVLVGSTLALHVLPVALAPAGAATNEPALTFVANFGRYGHGLPSTGTPPSDTWPQFDQVADVAVSPSGEMYVVEVGNHRVQRLASDGTFLSSWGGPTPGTAPRSFDAPESIAVDASGDVYVADTGNDRVQRFSATGTFEAQWGSTGAGHGQFHGPSGIDVDPATGDVFVADAGNDRVQRFSAGGLFEAAWTGGMDDPGDLVMGAGGRLYVADRGHGRVRRFTRAGGSMSLFEPVGLGNTNQPGIAVGLALDPDGNLYVSGGNDWVDMYSRSGVFVVRFSVEAEANSGISAVAVDAARRLLTFEDGYQRDRGHIHQLPSGALVAVRAEFDDPSGSVGVPLTVQVGVVNTGTTVLTGLTVVDPNAPNCSGPQPDLAPGEERLIECTQVPTAPGSFSHTATVDSDQTPPVVSEAQSVDVSVAPGPVLIDEWGVAGEGPGQLDAPRGMVVDHNGDVLIADAGNDVVSRFDGSGTFESEFVFADPDDVDVDPFDNVYVLRSEESTGGTVAKFLPGGSLEGSWFAGYATGIGAGQDGRVWRMKPQQDCDFSCAGREPRAFPDTAGTTGSFPVADGRDVVVHDATDRVYVYGLSGDIAKYTRTGQSVGTLNAGLVYDMDLDAAGRLYAVVHPSGRPDAVKVFDPDGTLLARWVTPADLISVAPDGTVYVLDVEGNRVRHFGFGLSGAVSESGSGDPVAGSWVLAIESTSGQLVGTTTGHDGGYSAAVGVGDRWVGFLDPTGDHAGEWYDNHPLSDLGAAEQVTVHADQANVADAALAPAGRTARVAGTVTGDGGGGPLAGVFVGVVDLSTGVLAGGAVTAGDGSFAVDGLTAGEHLVVFVDPTGARRFEFFDDSPTPGGSEVLDMVAGQTATANAGLAAVTPAGTGAHVSGTVTGDGEPLAGGLVVALDAADFSFVRGGYTDASGNYDLALPAGSYRVEFVDPAAAHAGEWHADQPLTNLAGATPVGVGSGGTADVDADLDPSGFTGAIGGTVTGPDGEAAQGVWVAVVRASDFSFVAGAEVDADGSYEVGDLAAGSYVVAFLDPAGGYRQEWYQHAAGPGTATPVAVTAGTTATADATLAPAP